MKQVNQPLFSDTTTECFIKLNWQPHKLSCMWNTYRLLTLLCRVVQRNKPVSFCHNWINRIYGVLGSLMYCKFASEYAGKNGITVVVWCSLGLIFTGRQHSLLCRALLATIGLTVRLSFCLSVRQSYAGTDWKRRKLGSRNHHHG